MTTAIAKILTWKANIQGKCKEKDWNHPGFGGYHLLYLALKKIFLASFLMYQKVRRAANWLRENHMGDSNIADSALVYHGPGMI